MALTYTPEAEIGSSCPQFSLLATDGHTYSLDSFSKAKGLLVMFICNHCPYVQAIEDRLIELARNYRAKGVAFVAICSNDAENYPEDSFESLTKRWREKEYGFPYLYDESQSVAKSFGAVCTPDFFLYDGERKLAYRGRLDDSWKDPSKVTQEELKMAMDSVLLGQEPSPHQNPSMGCSIKWK